MRKTIWGLLAKETLSHRWFNQRLKNQKKEKAKLARLIEPNGPTHRYWIVFDLDRTDAGMHWDNVGAPAPNIIARNPATGHAHLFYLLQTCWRRCRIDPVTEMPLTQSDSSRTISCAGLLPIGVGSVLRRHVGQFGVGAYIQEAIGHTKAESTCLGWLDLRYYDRGRHSEFLWKGCSRQHCCSLPRGRAANWLLRGRRLNYLAQNRSQIQTGLNPTGEGGSGEAVELRCLARAFAVR